MQDQQQSLARATTTHGSCSQHTYVDVSSADCIGCSFREYRRSKTATVWEIREGERSCVWGVPQRKRQQGQQDRPAAKAGNTGSCDGSSVYPFESCTLPRALGGGTEGRGPRVEASAGGRRQEAASLLHFPEVSPLPAWCCQRLSSTATATATAKCCLRARLNPCAGHLPVPGDPRAGEPTMTPVGGRGTRRRHTTAC